MEHPIIRAAKRGDLEAVRVLLAADSSLVSLRDPEDSTALHWAAWKGHAGIAALLLEHGADVQAANRNTHWGTTPLHAAAHANRKAVAEVLLSHGADPGALNLNHRTPLDETEFHRAGAVARLLESRGAPREPGATR